MIIGGGNAFINGVHSKCLCVRLNDFRMVRLFIPATNYVFRVNDVVSWNDTEVYWHPSPETCIKFEILGAAA